VHFIYRIKQLILFFGDLLSFAIGFWLSLLVRNFAIPTFEQIQVHVLEFSILFSLWILLNYINGLYDLDKQSNPRIFYRRQAETAGIALMVSIIFFYVLPIDRLTPKTILILNILFGYGLMALWRLGYNTLVGTKRLQTRVILVGYTEETKDLIDLISTNDDRGYKIVALIDADHTIKGTNFPDIDVYHGLNTIRPAITNYKANLVVIAPHLERDPAALRELYELLFWPVEINNLTSFYEQVTGRIPPSTFSEAWFLEHLRHTRQPIYDRFRTAIDGFFALVMLVTFAVLFPFIALAIKLTSSGPIFIKQKRIGLGGQPFLLYKFRSMYALSKDGMAEISGVEFAKKDDKRVTSVGKFLRRTRLDELPQVFNLIKRDVTLIGPRPERPEIIEELERRMAYYPLRHLVRPGLTGWALIHQNYTDNYDTSLQKLQYDLYYIKNRSMLLDLSILLRTINVIIRLMGQ
jgi:exopolysaccharide biosynthesis polyprenyl glycosylphosphotransferase